MTFEQFQIEGTNLTKDEIDVLSKQVLEEYQLAYKEISAELEKQYAKLLSGVKPEDYYNEMMKFNRLEKLQEEIRQMYFSHASKAGNIIENISFVSFSNSYYRMQYAASWMASFPVGILPYSLAEFAVYGTAESWKRITTNIEKIYGNASLYKSKAGTLLDLLTKNKTQELLKIQSAITQGLLQGKSYPKMADTIKELIGKIQIDSKGNVTTTGSSANAMRIIRTESNRTMNAGHYANSKYLNSIGVDIKRRLVSILDNRTRGQSARMDGQEVGVDEPFHYSGVAGKGESMYPGNTGIAAYDINDRETTIDIMNGESPEFREGKNPITGEYESFSYKDFSAWAKEKGLKRNKYGELLFPES